MIIIITTLYVIVYVTVIICAGRVCSILIILHNGHLHINDSFSMVYQLYMGLYTGILGRQSRCVNYLIVYAQSFCQQNRIELM